MTEDRACCDQIVQTTSRVKSLEDWRDEYIVSAQRWREMHTVQNDESNRGINEKLDRIEQRLTTFVNPILAIVISLLTALIGVLAGALWVLAR